MQHCWICKDCSSKATVIAHPNGEVCPQADPVTKEAGRLYSVWVEALDVKECADDPTPYQDAAEQQTYDNLIDYVEANDLNYSNWDPRGPKED